LIGSPSDGLYKTIAVYSLSAADRKGIGKETGNSSDEVAP
jgi:hypothetical protein